MHSWTTRDINFMHRALALARRGEGFVEPNPMVGCVLVRNGRIIAEGFHRRFGGPHAEVISLAKADRAARGSTAYVTLEPCCHHAKTPPCTDALIAACVGRVIAAIKDPNPLVAGKGLRALRRAGIKTAVGLLEGEAATLIAPFATRLGMHRPYVILKWAQSIDGKIATRSGDSKWISSPQSRRAAHALRARVDAVIVGIGTVLADDPDLRPREIRPRRRAVRVVLDAHLRTPPTARLVRTARRWPTLIVTSAAGWARSAARRKLEAAGCEVVCLVGKGNREEGAGRRAQVSRRSSLGQCSEFRITPRQSRGLSDSAFRIPHSEFRIPNSLRPAPPRVSLPSLFQLLYARQMTNVLVEGGGAVLGSFLEHGVADEAVIFVAPRLIGGEAAPGPLRGLGPETMRQVPVVQMVKARRLGPDLCYNVVF